MKTDIRERDSRTIEPGYRRTPVQNPSAFAMIAYTTVVFLVVGLYCLFVRAINGY